MRRISAPQPSREADRPGWTSRGVARLLLSTRRGIALLSALLLATVAGRLPGQEGAGVERRATSEATPVVATSDGSIASITDTESGTGTGTTVLVIPDRSNEAGPPGYRSVTLGMSREAVRAALLDDPLFGYRGEPDVSLLAGTERSIIESSGDSYVARSFFQFDSGALATITLLLDDRLVDYFTMFTQLTKRYGEPNTLSPRDAVWAFRDVRLSLERPLTVKYIDQRVLDRLLSEAQAGEELRARALDAFLESF